MTTTPDRRLAVDPVAGLPARERLRVNEIFYSIQGESTFAGRPCVLVRLTGCQMRCTWCDTEYSFYEGAWMRVDDVIERVLSYECPLAEVTGGEPLLQPGVHTLMSGLCDRGLDVLLETGGGLDISSVDPRVRRIVDLKCPGSGEAANNHWPNIEALRQTDEVKFVLADREDYEWARDAIRRHRLDRRCTVHLSPVWGALQPAELASWVLEDRLPARVSMQLHKALWGAETRGV
ncbi:MAG: radical SAM protein [Acidobacteriota bacterium]|nr:radical SAM protein [Acidobacteriota bacterium]MDE3264449.1 radical SAM protein [Acidobacteriota bacterium]